MNVSSIEQFFSLTPDVIFGGVEDAGFMTTGTLMQLNSYENRVYEVHLERDLNPATLSERLIAKYYRPQRWTREAILEEHFFLDELQTSGIPVIAPLRQKNNQTLSTHEGIHLAVFPKCQARMPQELTHEQLTSIGRLLARIHNVGEQSDFHYRPVLDPESFGWPTIELLEKWVAPEVWTRYKEAASQILDFLDDFLDEDDFIRIHGDCHKGNLLLKDSSDGSKAFFFVDFDDSVMGPPAQDLWMLFSGDDMQGEYEAILSGYEELRSFDRSQEKLFAPLRGLRILHYAGWIARRWSDPSFPKLFPHFNTYNYWAEEAEALERIAWSL